VTALTPKLSTVIALALLGCGPSHRGAEQPSGNKLSALPRSEKRLEAFRPTLAPHGSPAPLLVTLKEELERNVRELKARANPAPYFVSYEAIDDHSVTIEVSFGALKESSEDAWRALDVDVRVGDRKLDSTHRMRGDADGMRDFTRSGWLPIEEDASAVRSVAWLTTHVEYERAVEDLDKVRANKRVMVDEEDTSDDFSEEPVSNFHERPAALSLDRPAWEARLRRDSKPFSEHPEIFESSIVLDASAQTRYLAQSEGSTLQVARTHARIDISASTTADDGMRLERSETVDVDSAAALPGDDKIEAIVRNVIADLLALRKAPLVDPYAGPAILDGRAAGVFFHEIFGHRIEGHRQKDEEEGQTFARKVGEAIMPAFLDVYDDPSISVLNGVQLNGYYPFDDEAIRGQRVTLVERGVLRGFLMSRSPARGFVRSNGHGRRERGHRVVSRQANLIVDPVVTTTPAALKARLIEEVRTQGKPFGLRFKEITGGYTNTTRMGTQAFKVLPVMVYRVYLDGREELVRGVDLEGTPLVALARIEAAANDFAVFNGVCGAESGWVPVSASSPSILVGQIEITRRQKGHDRPPLLPAPKALRKEVVR
jgi:predicted Zn-dependent protease